MTVSYGAILTERPCWSGTLRAGRVNNITLDNCVGYVIRIYVSTWL